MKYAPVCIPTLNRYEHLRKCLESLSNCSWAENTEVYVALDYPPTDKWDYYAPGWEKNREFLHSCGNMGFKELHVIERDENYGIWLPGHKGNLKCLIEGIKKKYDRYIVTEDDNVFAPSFLEYINKGLVKFENDEKVISITGYKFYNPNIVFESNNFVRQDLDFCCWGYGMWTRKIQSLPKLDYHWFRRHLTPRAITHIYKKAGLGAVCQLVSLSCASKRTSLIDADLWTYCQITDRQQLFPSESLVENIGLDGSGATLGDFRGQEWCNPALNPLSKAQHFYFQGTGYEHFENNQKAYRKIKYYRSDFQYAVKLCKKVVKLLLHL